MYDGGSFLLRDDSTSRRLLIFSGEKCLETIQLFLWMVRSRVAANNSHKYIPYMQTFTVQVKKSTFIQSYLLFFQTINRKHTSGYLASFLIHSLNGCPNNQCILLGGTISAIREFFLEAEISG